ncbi:ATP-grasp domain-containing protein [Lusitaniella coriacea]|uniref:ATP-grasp domain-containing protein n=1 Tax=Lusitaniella coriacea TaxID=1983105 RepID=UPI003CF1BFEB
MLSALKQLKIPEPKTNDYPDSLQKFLHRKIWKSSLASLEWKLHQGIEQPIFAKPARRRKQFTGRVFHSFHDLWYVSGTSRKEEIFFSEVVSWISEYRVYVTRAEIVGIHYYSGDSDTLLNETVVFDAIRCLEKAGESVAGYSLDFGVLATGETALIEMNDGFSLGNHGLKNKTYTDLVLARWEELMSSCEDAAL